MKLDKLIQNIEVISVIGNSENMEINNITNNSKDVDSGSLFVAVKGFTVDGHKFITNAISNGANAIVVDNENESPEELFIQNNVVRIVVKESRKSFADLSCNFYEHPSKQLKLVGITGSNGKTTTSFYIKNLFETAGYNTGLLGTISNIVGELEDESSLTTPESNTINRYLRNMVDAGITHCVMEVSSHSLTLDRVRGLNFDYAIFTNISSDHLDFHSDFENYLNAKKILFDNLDTSAKVIYNNDDENWGKLLADCTNSSYSYGKNISSNFTIDNVSYNMDGTSFELTNTESKYKFTTSLIGEFNAYNATCAAIIGVNEKYSKEIITKGINTTPQVPGRFEVVGEGNKKAVIDYSHTADSLEKALQAIHTIVAGSRSIHTVFGCGGDRDKSKRPIMGRIADQLSDEIYVTSDNPRSENPFEIIDEILSGVKRDNPNVVEDREAAIKSAICNSDENAVILIAGKGHEDYQLIDGVKHHFSDKEMAIKYLESCD